MKKIFLFILFYSTFLGARDEMGRWVMLGTARNGNQTNPMSFDIRFNEIEDVTQPYGWRFGEPWPRIAGGDFINVGQIISIGPNKSLDLQNTVIPQAGSKGHPSEKRIEFKGVGEQTNEYGGLEYFEISPGTMLKLDALRGKAFAWLIQSISNRAVSFWAQTEGKLEIAIGSQIGPDYLLKIILGQKKSKIITKEEEQEEFAITEDNKQLIKYTDQVILQNIKTGKVLSFNYVKNIIESGAYSENLNKIPKKSIWTIKQTYKPYKQQDKKKDVFLEHGKTIALFNDDKYLSGRFGGATSLEPVLLDWEKWTIQKIDSSNSHIKNGDIIKLLSAHQAGYLVFDPNDIAANRWPQQNPDNIWKIMLAQAPEQKIYQRKYPLIKKEENARAMATPGFEGTYWISIIDNYLFVGSGYRPGEDLFFFKALPESIKGQTNFIGFGCKNKKAFYSNFMLSDPIDTVLPKEKYTDIPEIKPTAQFQILENMPLRISTKGSVSFQAKSQEPIYIGFFEKNDTESLKYKVALGKDNNTSVAIYKDKKESPIFKTYTLEKNILSNDKFDDFLISINDGLITVFKDRKLILAWQDSTPAKSYQNVGLSTKDDNAKIKNIEISAPITVESQKMEREYREKIQAHQTIDNVHLKLVAPYTYWLRQSGFNLEIEDPVYTNRTWKLFALEKMGEHNIMVSISKSGIPDIRYKHDPTGHPLEKILRIGANVLGGTGAALSQIPNPKVQAAGLVTGIAGQTLGSFTDAFFAETKRIYTEESRKIQAESIEEAKIKVYTENINKLLKDFEAIRDIQSIAELDLAIEIHDEILDKIVNPNNAQIHIRKKILRNLDIIKNKIDELNITGKNAVLYNKFINLLTKAYDNIFLFDKNQKKDVYRNINILLKELFSALKNKKLESILINPFHGEYIWYPEAFETPDIGTVFFQASGLENIIVGFYDEKAQVRYTGQPKEVYQIMIGGWGNKITAICADSDAQAVQAYVTSKENPDAMAPFTDFRTYFASINKGYIVFGIIKNGKIIKILDWQDPYPRKNFKYVGFSCWNHQIQLKNINLKNISFNNPDFTKVATEVSEKFTKEVETPIKRSTRRPVEIKGERKSRIIKREVVPSA